MKWRLEYKVGHSGEWHKSILPWDRYKRTAYGFVHFQVLYRLVIDGVVVSEVSVPPALKFEELIELPHLAPIFATLKREDYEP